MCGKEHEAAVMLQRQRVVRFNRNVDLLAKTYMQNGPADSMSKIRAQRRDHQVELKEQLEILVELHEQEANDREVYEAAYRIGCST